MDKVDALILAGAPAGPDLDPSGEAGSRAMIQLAGRSMLAWVVDALRGCPLIGRIAAVGRVTADGLDSVIEPGGDLVTNIRRGLESLRTTSPVLLTSSDIPLLTAEAVEDFVSRALPMEADMVYPIVPRSECEKRYPGLKRTYVKTADGVFTGGNIMLVRPDFVDRSWDTIAEAYAARKQPLRLARIIGTGALARVLVGQFVPPALRVSTLERAASRALRAKIAALVSDYPEIGEDVDKPSDLAAIGGLLMKANDG